MNWQKVAEKLRAVADQHAQNAQNELLRGNKNTAEREHHLFQIFYGFHVALEAGLEDQQP